MKKQNLSGLIVILLFLFVSCSTTQKEVSQSLAEDPSQTVTTTPSPTKTRIPTLLPATPITPSPTPKAINYEVIPTLPAYEVYGYFSSLFDSLGDDSTPNWGPILLGDTTMEEAHEILGPLSYPEFVENETWSEDNNEYYLYSSASWRKRIEDTFVEWVLYGFNEKVQEIHFSIKGNPNTLQHFFASYGKPDEVWLALLLPQFAERNIFVGFFYEHKNIFIWYDIAGEIIDNVQHGCGLTLFDMAAWAEEHEEQALDDLYAAFYPGEEIGLREVSNLLNLTSWNIDTFYEEHMNKSDQEICITVNLDTGE